MECVAPGFICPPRPAPFGPELSPRNRRTLSGGIEGACRIKVGNMVPARCEESSRREHREYALLQAPLDWSAAVRHPGSGRRRNDSKVGNGFQDPVRAGFCPSDDAGGSRSRAGATGAGGANVFATAAETTAAADRTGATVAAAGAVEQSTTRQPATQRSAAQRSAAQRSAAQQPAIQQSAIPGTFRRNRDAPAQAEG